MNNIEVLNC